MIFSSTGRLISFSLLYAMMLFISFHPVSKFGYSNSDESYYYRYALQVEAQGPAAFSRMIRWYDSNDEARQHPFPLRIAYIALMALLFKWFGPSYYLLGLCSLVSFLLFLFVCFYYARRHFNDDIALGLVLLLASSPLMQGMSRRALLDSTVNLLWGGLVWMFLDFLTKPDSRKYVFVIFLLALSILVKESSVVLIPFFVVSACWFKYKGTALRWAEIFGIIGCPLLITLVVYWMVLGSAADLYQAVLALLRTHLTAHPGFYALAYSSGPWFRYLLDFLLLNPIVTLLAVAYLGFLVGCREMITPKTGYFLSYFIFVYALLNLLPHTKVVRFVLNLEMALNLFALLMLIEIFKPSEGSAGRRRILAALLLIVIVNWGTFYQLFYMKGLLDPVSYHLFVFRHLIPAF